MMCNRFFQSFMPGVGSLRPLKSAHLLSRWRLGVCSLLLSSIATNVSSQVLLSAFNFGGTQSYSDSSLAVDARGNVLVTGQFEGTADFDPGPGTVNLTSNGHYDVFVAKYDPAGNFLFAFGIGSWGPDWGNSIATDKDGNILVTGMFVGTVDFDPGPGVTNLSSKRWSTDIFSSSEDIFVAKYDPAGNLVFAFSVGDIFQDEAQDITTDVNGNIVITGYFQGSADFDPGPGVINLSNNLAVGSYDKDIFVAKYDPSGHLLFAFRISNGLTHPKVTDWWNGDTGYSVSTDRQGNIVVTGFFDGTADFDPGPGVTNLSSDGYQDIFVAKYDPSGHLLFAFNIGSDPPAQQYGKAVATDALGNIIVGGELNNSGGTVTSDFDPGPGVTNISVDSPADAFVAKYDPDGRLLFALKLDGSATYPYSGSVEGIATNATGNIFVTGYFDNAIDFDPGPGSTTLTTNGGNDIFLAKYDPDGHLLTAFNVGGDGVGYDDAGRDVALSASGDIIITGGLGYNDGAGVDFDPGGGVTNLYSSAPFNVFVARYADDNTSPASDLVINIGAIGLWARINDTSWLKLSNNSPEQVAVADMDGNGQDDVVAVYGSGIFVKRNLGGWTQLHNYVPEALAVGDLDANGKDDLVIDFGSIGLWARMNDASWLKLNNASPTQIAVGDMDGNGADDVIAVFGSGIFVKRNLGGWTQLHNFTPEALAVGDLDGNGKDDLVVDFGGIGLWARMNDASWLKLHNSSPELIATGDLDGNGADDVLATFSSLGLWQKLNLGGWSTLSNSAPDAVVTGDVDGTGKDDVIADFGSTLGGIFVKRDQGAWTKLHNTSPDSMAVGNLDNQ